MTDRTRTDLTFTKRNEDGDDIINVNISWENGDWHALQNNLNTWLRSINVPLKVVANKLEVTDPTYGAANGQDPF